LLPKNYDFKEFATKEKLEIVSGAAPPPFRILAGGIFSEKCVRTNLRILHQLF